MNWFVSCGMPLLAITGIWTICAFICCVFNRECKDDDFLSESEINQLSLDYWKRKREVSEDESDRQAS